MTIQTERLINIRAKIRNSSVRKILSETVRWSRFRTDESIFEWVSLLGPTAVVLTHQEHFVDFFIEWSDALDSDTRNHIILAGSIHDLGEAEKGDIAAPFKTHTDEIEEYQQAINTLGEIGFDKADELALIEEYRLVVEGKDQGLHHIFKAFEKTEYLDTAIHLFLAMREGKQMEKGNYMISRVLLFDLPKIIDYAISLPNLIGSYLQAQSELISEMFIFTNSSVEISLLSEFTESKTKWNKFLAVEWLS